MRTRVLPSIMVKNQKDLSASLKRLDGVAKKLHLDVGDGQFILKKYLWFPFRLSKKFKYNAHLMVKNPEEWIKKNIHKVDEVVFHPESLKEEKIFSLIALIKQKKKKAGLALKPETKVSVIKNFLPEIDYVLILTVHPGFYEAKFMATSLKKIELIKKINPKVKVIVDGGMKPGTIGKAVKAGGDYFVSGSFVTRAERPMAALKELGRNLTKN